ncbi:MAG: type I glyceraldehyde-3-phosphate dehydrogenase [Candidatus Wildermuthbacteria bacterium GWA2_46_15]|uniref:Type I glyceraldehyde-3-phosphate dehydrogenase n=1 Tax=Candidatus Wildermuthbacteria bacterium GWA2_46_15 TaxID=1802443 RepID=A0A1G2QPB3_9BACT|nr:MAG: type I glyceraldehyde-3-phosphate dehydrogenase [Candidatus Wildermuthbacteria bacterium GWA2_46_15]
MVKIAINGFGRIGRLTLRRILENHPDLEVVAINDLTDSQTLAYLLKHDSVYGTWGKEVSPGGGDQGSTGKIMVDGKSILVFAEQNILVLPWEKLGIDIVIESTGRFTKRGEAAKHLEAGAKKVVISANAKDADISLVLGVNENQYDPAKHDVISNCSCTTNCAAPTLKVLHDSLGVEKAIMTTIHAVTQTQSLVDGPKTDLREGRAAFQNVIPAGTGASEAIARILPQLEGKISGSAYRVPVISGSVLEIVAQIKKETSVDEINRIFEQAAKNEMKGALAVSHEELVSSDIVGRPEAAIIDLPLTEVINLPKTKDKNLVKVVAWYDNEWGYSCRLVALTEFIARRI